MAFAALGRIGDPETIPLLSRLAYDLNPYVVVDAVYEADPKTHAGAKRFNDLTYREFLERARDLAEQVHTAVDAALES